MLLLLKKTYFVFAAVTGLGIVNNPKDYRENIGEAHNSKNIHPEIILKLLEGIQGGLWRASPVVKSEILTFPCALKVISGRLHPLATFWKGQSKSSCLGSEIHSF